MAKHSDAAYQWLDHRLQVIHRAHWYRSVKQIERTGQGGAEITLQGQNVVNFASNDYLGLATHPKLKEAAIAAINEYGTGATGSRLLSGQRPIHQQLETAIAQWKQTEDAVVFSSGYLANLSVIQAIVGPKDLILGDAFNHSSLKNGAKLCGATTLDFAHNDVAQLRQLLLAHRSQFRRCLIAVDGVFSMDGDLCPLPELLDLATEFETMLLVDEAHGTGVLGATGSGVVEHFQRQGVPLIQVGTLSKALGSLGGYVAGTATLIDFLRNRGAGWIYTTGLAPADCASALAAVDICRRDRTHQKMLWQNVKTLKRSLQKLCQEAQGREITLLPTDSAIICLEMDKPETVLALSQSFLAEGLFVPAIRPPTVPTSRLRLSVMATHQPQHLERLLGAIAHHI